MQKTIVVTSCAECPFFATTVVSILSVAFKQIGQDRLVGECNCPEQSGLMHFKIGADPSPEVDAERVRRSRRLKIFDGNVMPASCPLRGAARVVEAG